MRRRQCSNSCETIVRERRRWQVRSCGHKNGQHTQGASVAGLKIFAAARAQGPTNAAHARTAAAEQVPADAQAESTAAGGGQVLAHPLVFQYPVPIGAKLGWPAAQPAEYLVVVEVPVQSFELAYICKVRLPHLHPHIADAPPLCGVQTSIATVCAALRLAPPPPQVLSAL